MPAEPLPKLLEQILTCAARIQHKTSQHTLQSLRLPSATDDFDVICYRFVIIAECTNHIRDHYPATSRRISQTSELAAFRIWLTHRFYKLDPRKVWENSGGPLDQLVAEVRQLQRLYQQPPPPTP